MIGRVVVPFDTFPAVHVRPHYGAPVVKGDTFSALLCSGVWKD